MIGFPTCLRMAMLFVFSVSDFRLVSMFRQSDTVLFDSLRKLQLMALNVETLEVRFLFLPG